VGAGTAAAAMVGVEQSKKDDDPAAGYVGTAMAKGGGGGAMEAKGSHEDVAGTRLMVPSSHLPSLALAQPVHKDEAIMSNRGGEGEERTQVQSCHSFILRHVFVCFFNLCRLIIHEP